MTNPTYHRLALGALSSAALLALAACSTGAPVVVVPPVVIPQTAPHIVAVTGEGTAQITVTAEDVNGDDIFVTAVAPAGVMIAAPTKTIPGGSGSATFDIASTSTSAEATGAVTIQVSDSAAPLPVTRLVTFKAPKFAFAPDTLYAIPQATTVAVGQPVRIVVSTGVMANPLCYMTGVRVKTAFGMHYQPSSFNVGTPGGGREDKDGVWSALPSRFYILQIPDSFLDGQPYTAFSALDFNVTPVSSTGTTATDFFPIPNATGDLFSFEVTFDTPGVYPLTFEAHDIVDRTFYHSFNPNDETGYDGNFWGDISNAGAPANTITVTP